MHPNRRWRASRSRARSPRMHHASYPVFVHRPAALDWASNRSQSSRRSSGQEQSSLLLETPLPPSAPRLTTAHLPFSLPSALRSGVRRTAGAAKPGHRTCTYEVTRHARRTRWSSRDVRQPQAGARRVQRRVARSIRWAPVPKSTPSACRCAAPLRGSARR